MTFFEKITAKKSLGQHFLNNPTVSEAMVEAANVGEGDIVVEVGPGTGVLTKVLLDKGAHVIALEIDDRSVAALKKTFPEEIDSKKLTILYTDVRDLDPATLDIPGGEYKIVANIPYYISGKLFRTFLETPKHPSVLVFLVQKEVAERIVRDEKESLLSLSIKVFGRPEYIKTVKKGNFSPPPKVDSAVIAVKDISHERINTVGASFFFELLHLGFQAKRKQLLGNLSKSYDREVLMHTFSTLGLPVDVRGEDVSAENWLLLATELKKI